MEQNQTSQTKQVFGQKDGTEGNEGNEAIRQDFLCAVGKGQDVRAKLTQERFGSTNWLCRFITDGSMTVADQGSLGSSLARQRVMGIRYALAGALMTLLLVVGWRFYAGWRMGRIELITEGEPVVMQVLAERSDTAIGEAFDLARSAVVELPAGEYRVRVNGKGRLGRTYRFGVNRGETQSHAISIDEGRLLRGEPNIESTHVGDYWRRGESFPFAPVTSVVELTPGVARVIEWSNEHLICRDGARGRVIWDAFHPAKAVRPRARSGTVDEESLPQGRGRTACRAARRPQWRRHRGFAVVLSEDLGVACDVRQGRVDAVELCCRSRWSRRTATGWACAADGGWVVEKAV